MLKITNNSISNIFSIASHCFVSQERLSFHKIKSFLIKVENKFNVELYIPLKLWAQLYLQHVAIGWIQTHEHEVESPVIGGYI